MPSLFVPIERTIVEKLKAFYEEHKSAVIIGAVGGGVTATIMAVRFLNGQKLTSASFYMRDDENAALIVVTKKNGKSQSFVKYRPKEVPAA